DSIATSSLRTNISHIILSAFQHDVCFSPSIPLLKRLLEYAGGYTSYAGFVKRNWNSAEERTAIHDLLARAVDVYFIESPDSNDVNFIVNAFTAAPDKSLGLLRVLAGLAVKGIELRLPSEIAMRLWSLQEQHAAAAVLIANQRDLSVKDASSLADRILVSFP